MSLLLALTVAAGLFQQEIPDDYDGTCFQGEGAQTAAEWMESFTSHAAFTARVSRVKQDRNITDNFSAGTSTGTVTFRSLRYLHGVGPSQATLPYSYSWNDSLEESGEKPDRGDRYLILLDHYEIVPVPAHCVTDFDTARPSE